LHELGIIFHVIEQVEEVCKENRLKTVASVTLEIGEVSGVVGSYLTDCWVWAAEKSEFLKGSALKIEWLPALRCATAAARHTGLSTMARPAPTARAGTRTSRAAGIS